MQTDILIYIQTHTDQRKWSYINRDGDIRHFSRTMYSFEDEKQNKNLHNYIEGLNINNRG